MTDFTSSSKNEKVISRILFYISFAFVLCDEITRKNIRHSFYLTFIVAQDGRQAGIVVDVEEQF